MSEPGVTKLAQKHCVPCRGGTPPITGSELLTYAEQLPDWKIIEEHHIAKIAPGSVSVDEYRIGSKFNLVLTVLNPLLTFRWCALPDLICSFLT